MAKSSSCRSSSFWLQQPKLTKKTKRKKKRKALKCLLNPNSKFQSLTTQFLSAKGEHRAISANQIAILLPSLPPVTVGLRVAQRPLQIRYGVGWSGAPASGPEGPTSLFLHVALCPRDPTKVPHLRLGKVATRR